jgi:hypothetical protein
MTDYAITLEDLQKTTKEFKAIVAARVERRVTAIWSGTANRRSVRGSGETAARYHNVLGTGLFKSHRPVARQYITTLANRHRRGGAAQLLLAIRTNSLALSTRKGSVTARRRQDQLCPLCRHHGEISSSRRRRTSFLDARLGDATGRLMISCSAYVQSMRACTSVSESTCRIGKVVTTRRLKYCW